MQDPGNTRPSSSDRNGDAVRVTPGAAAGRRASLLYKGLALALIGGSAAYWLIDRNALSSAESSSADASAPHAASSETLADARDDDAGPPAARGANTMPRREITARPARPTQPEQEVSIDLASYAVPGEPVPSTAEIIDRLHKAGIHSGIGAFSPPGTSPPLIGLAVPDDYALPEGYVRHSQATDDGQRIEPILMFSPDYEFFDASGGRIEIPENRVVPPELAPPGLTVRPIKLPPPRDGG